MTITEGESPLNPKLYNLLRLHFGDVVRIANPGIEIQWTLTRPADDDPEEDSRPSRNILIPGEEYYLPCPICNDHKPRLYINHRWGVWDEETRSRNIFLVNCFNEDCFREYEPREWLFRRVYNRRYVRPDDLVRGKEVSVRLAPIDPPGKLIRMDELAQRDPGHSAVRYLAQRGFDPVRLGRHWGVGYVYDSAYWLADKRIFIPIFERGILYGWQARYIGDRYEGKPLKEAGIPKYYTMPGMPRSWLGYNMDTAVRHQTIVIVEGPMDAWSVGPQAFAVLGKTLSHTLMLKLKYWIHLYWGPETVLFVMLDPDQSEEEKKRRRPHHIQVATERLISVLGPEFEERVIPIYLPSGRDPGSLSREYLWRWLKMQADLHGVEMHCTSEWRKPALPPEVLEYGPEKFERDKRSPELIRRVLS